MRWVLYIFSLVVFVLFRYMRQALPDQAEKFYHLWIFSFVAICTEVVIRIWPSRYAFFPIGYAVVFLYLYFGGPYAHEAHTIGSLLHVVLGIVLLINRKKVNAKESEGRLFMLVTGITSLVFGLQFLTWFDALAVLQTFYQFNLTSYILLASGGRFALSQISNAFYPELRAMVPVMLIYHIYLITEQLMNNFLF